MPYQALLHEDGLLKVHSLSTDPNDADSSTLNDTDVVIKVAFCGLCGSDLKEYQGAHNFAPDPQSNEYKNSSKTKFVVKYPFAMGHEFSGIIAAVGARVHELDPALKVGSKCVVNPTFACKEQGVDGNNWCNACKHGETNICKNLCLRGLSAPGGGLSTTTKIPASSVIPVPDTLSLELAALAQPLAIAWHAVRISNFAMLAESDKTAVVFGAGPIGLATVLSLIGMGARAIVVAEMADIRCEQAQKLLDSQSLIDKNFQGIVVNPAKLEQGTTSRDAIVRAVDPVFNEGASRTFDCAGVVPTFNDSLACLKSSGVAVNLAIWPMTGPKSQPPISPMKMTMSEKCYMGSMGLNNIDMLQVVEAIDKGRISQSVLQDMITAVYPLDKVNEAFQELISNKDNQMKVLIQVDI